MLPESSTPQSPLEALSTRRFEGKTYANETVVTVGTTRLTLVKNNPNRLFWIAINESASDMRLSIDPGVTLTSGWLIPAQGGVISMFWEQDGESVGYEVFVIAPVAACNIRVREIIRL